MNTRSDSWVSIWNRRRRCEVALSDLQVVATALLTAACSVLHLSRCLSPQPTTPLRGCASIETPTKPSPLRNPSPNPASTGPLKVDPARRLKLPMAAERRLDVHDDLHEWLRKWYPAQLFVQRVAFGPMARPTRRNVRVGSEADLNSP